MGDNVVGNRFSSMNLDAGRTPEKKTKWTASACAHIITALIGSGVLSLPWAMAQLGWIAGLTVMLLSSLVTFATFSLLAACYSSSNPPNGKRNCTYMDADPDILGTCKFKVFQLLYYVNLSGVAIGYTIEAAKSMKSISAIRKLKCFDIGGEKNPWLVITFGLIQIILSEIYDTISLVRFISIIVTAVMSFIYSVIGLFLSIARVAKTGKVGGSLTGTTSGISTQKTWRMFQALGDIAFAYSYSIILSESHDIIKSPQSEVKTMIKALLISVGVTTLFYLLCGCFGYAAFGDLSPEDLLTGLGFHDPYWLLDIANIAIVIHLVGAYCWENYAKFSCKSD